jgi:hypothetical protein
MTAEHHRIDEVLAYASAGMRIFPCWWIEDDGRCSCHDRMRRRGGVCKPGKHPITRNGHLNATTNPTLLRQWWTHHPDANVGAAMDVSAYVGIDIDPRHGGDETWAAIVAESGGTIPDTWTNLTGGGGVHYIYRVPEGFVCQTGRLGPGIDVMWHGYLILPPSNHVSGTAYQWEVGASPFDREAAELPAYLVDLVQRRKHERGDDDSPVAELLLAPCPEGQRHTTLIRILGWACETLTEAEAEGVALAWNVARCTPPRDEDEILAEVTDAYARWGAPSRPILEDDEPEGPAPGETRWTLIRGSELRRMELPPVVWVLENMIPRGRYVVLSGESGLGKSWWALLFCLAAGTGQPFLGRQTAPVKALYIDEENGIQEAQRRLRALADGLGIPEDATLPVDFLIDESIKLGKARDVRELAAIVEAEAYTTILTDSLIRFFDGNENHSDEVAKFHAGVDFIRHRTGVDWIMLQHLNKAGANGGQVAPGDRLRGSGEFKAHADVHIQLRGTDGTSNVITHVEKLRGGVRPADVVYRLDGNTMLDEPVTMTVLGSTAAAMGAENAALMYACEFLENAGPLTVGELVKFLQERCGIASRTAEAAIASGRKSGAIVEDHKAGKHVFLRLGRGVF